VKVGVPREGRLGETVGGCSCVHGIRRYTRFQKKDARHVRGGEKEDLEIAPLRF